ncbi:hypothetical protein GYA49_02725 [Candidatus Beckwithbacteria bacterium]|nr:hypothetical protein [Candidatus Beckwithbacteria bacterium]
MTHEMLQNSSSLRGLLSQAIETLLAGACLKFLGKQGLSRDELIKLLVPDPNSQESQLIDPISQRVVNILTSQSQNPQISHS